MQVNYGNYFSELGFKNGLYNSESNEYDRDEIVSRIKAIEQKWKAKYPEFDFKTDKLKFENKVAFNQSFTTEVEYLNLETK
jgi:hypothetical protein